MALLDCNFEDKELENFYKFNATKRPNERNRSRGGVYFFKNITRQDVLNGEEKLNVIEFYRQAMLESGHDKESLVLKHVIDGAKLEIIRTCKVLFVPSAELGKEIVKRPLNKELRSLCQCFNSVINGKPNELARAMFA